MLSIIMPNVTYKPFVLRVVMVSVVRLNVIMLNVIMLTVVAPSSLVMYYKTFYSCN
jgi:hypothetical protein